MIPLRSRLHYIFLEGQSHDKNVVKSFRGHTPTLIAQDVFGPAEPNGHVPPGSNVHVTLNPSPGGASLEIAMAIEPHLLVIARNFDRLPGPL